MSLLAQTIYRTLAFFDCLNLPLSLLEIRNYLLAADGLPPDPSLSSIIHALEGELSGSLGFRSGFYFLKGRDDLVALRLKRYRTSFARILRARKILSLLRFFPFVRGVGISGSLSFLNSDEHSDIDLFVLAKSGRIWLARALLVLYFGLLGRRRHGRYVQNRFCLNHFVRAGLTVKEDRSLFTATSYAAILPVLGEESLRKFWQANGWISDFLQNPLFQSSAIFDGLGKSRPQAVLEKFLEMTGLGLLLNRFARFLQKRRIAPRPDIVVSEEELSFHFRTHSERVMLAFSKKVAKF